MAIDFQLNMSAEQETAGERMVMVCDPIGALPNAPLPAGYRMRLMGEADVSAWLAAQRAAEPYFAIADDLFERAFGSDLKAAWERCYVIETVAGEAAGVISAWWSDDFRGGRWGRLHWLAVVPRHQRKGLARAASVRVLQRLKGEFGRAYLVTQSKRAGAIRLYQSLGFELGGH